MTELQMTVVAEGLMFPEGPIALPDGSLTPYVPSPAASFGLGLRVNI